MKLLDLRSIEKGIKNLFENNVEGYTYKLDDIVFRVVQSNELIIAFQVEYAGIGVEHCEHPPLMKKIKRYLGNENMIFSKSIADKLYHQINELMIKNGQVKGLFAEIEEYGTDGNYLYIFPEFNTIYGFEENFDKAYNAAKTELNNYFSDLARDSPERVSNWDKIKDCFPKFRYYDHKNMYFIELKLDEWSI